MFFLVCFDKITPPFIDVRPFHTVIFYLPFKINIITIYPIINDIS